MLGPALISLGLGIALHLSVPRTHPVEDSSTYNALGAGIAGFHPYGPYYGAHWAAHGLTVRGLVVPLLVAFTYFVTNGVHPALFEWIQAVVLLPATTLLVYVAGREAFSRRCGLIAAWLFALWFPAAWMTLWLLTETTLNLMLAAFLALFAAALRRNSPRLAVAAGAEIALLSVSHAAYQFTPVLLVVILAAARWPSMSLLVRAGIGVLLGLLSVLLSVTHVGYGFPLVALAALLGWVCRRRGVRALRVAAALAAGIIAVTAPYTAISSAFGLAHLGEGAQGYGGGGGWTFYSGTRKATGWHPGPDDYRVADLSAPGDLVAVGRLIAAGKLRVEPHLLAIIQKKLHGPDPFHQTLVDADFYRAGIENLLSDGVSSWPSKLQYNAGQLYELPSSLELYAPHVYTATPWWLRPWRLASLVLALAAGVGLGVVTLRRRDRLILFAPAVVQALLLMVAVVESRYVVPLWSSMFLLVGAAVAATVEGIRALRTAAAPV